MARPRTKPIAATRPAPTGGSPLTAREKFAAVLAQLREGAKTIDQAIDNLKKQFPGIELKREDVYPLLRTGLAEGYIYLEPERDHETERVLRNDFGLTGVAVVPSVYFPDVAMRAARHILELLDEYIKLGKERVGIGFASGFSISHVARALAKLLRRTGIQLPAELRFHALSVGFNPEFLREDPNFFLSAFDSDSLYEKLAQREPKTIISFMGLYAPSIIPTEQLGIIQAMEGIKESIAAASDIDIVVTSASDFDDSGSTLAEFYKARPKEAKRLEKAGVKGHLLYLPIGDDGPISADKHEFILPTILTLQQLHEMIVNHESKRKYPARVVLVAGLTKEMRPKQVIYTILKQKQKVITDLITDQRSAKDVLDRFEAQRREVLGLSRAM